MANVDGTFLAFGNECTHVGGPLVEGEPQGETVTCPEHASVFPACSTSNPGQIRVKSGEVLEKPAEGPIPTYEVRAEGDEIQVWGS